MRHRIDGGRQTVSAVGLFRHGDGVILVALVNGRLAAEGECELGQVQARIRLRYRAHGKQ